MKDDRSIAPLPLPLSAWALTLLFGLFATSACSKPQESVDGRPVAISPMRGSGTEGDKSTPVPETTPTPTLDLEAEMFELKDGRTNPLDGNWVQDRCDDGMRETTIFAGPEVRRVTELFEAGACAKALSKTVSVFEINLKTVKGVEIDLKHTKELVTLLDEGEIRKANDADGKGTFRCLALDDDAAWTRLDPAFADAETRKWILGEERDVSALGECALGDVTFTRLEVALANADAKLAKARLRWGAPGQDDEGALLDGTSDAKRLKVLDGLPFVRSK